MSISNERIRSIVVAAPHPDDETLGVGGTLLRHKEAGHQVHWLIFSEMRESVGFSRDRIAARADEIRRVRESYGFDSVHTLGLPATLLDTIPLGEVVSLVGKVFNETQPSEVYLPHRGDIHSDHGVVFDAVSSCTKWFRYPSIKRVLAYETPSETELGVDPARAFVPNVFIDIEPFLDRKVSIMRLYEGEMGEFPFPRSEGALRALAGHRGAASGCAAAEAFMLLREIDRSAFTSKAPAQS